MERTERRGAQRGKSRKKGILIACLIVAALAAGYGGLCAAAGAETIYPNVMVGDVALGGMTCEEAEAALVEAEKTKTPDDSRGVVFELKAADGKNAIIKVPLSSVETDCTATAAQAWKIGNDASKAARGGLYLKCLVAGADVLPVYQNSAGFEAILDGAEAEIGQEAVESSWELTDTQLVLTKGQTGNVVDREKLKTETFDRLGRQDMVELANAQPQFTVDLEQALPKELNLQDVLGQVEKKVQNAEFNKAEKKFQVDSKGISFDAEQAQTTFDEMDWGQKKEVPLIITEPETTVADLTPQLYQDTLGTCSTNISGTANRVHNISLAAQCFNGTVLMPGEEFSYNGTVGRRTAERGFLPAPAYVSGETVQETGGGICQGSSTIYLATLRANLEIVERYNHGYITRYVPDGMDATVYYGAKDFRFKNNTPFPVKIVGGVSGRTLTVNIMGTKSDNIKIEMTNQTVGTSGYNTVYKVDNSLPAGSTRVSVTPYSGYTVKVYRNIYENGRLIDTKLESTNVYKSRDKVVLVSPNDAYKYGVPGYSAPAPKPAPAPNETTPQAET